MDRRSALLTYALERWQTLAVVILASAGIAGTVLFLDSSLPIILAWVAFAFVSVAAIVVVSFRDAESVDEALMAQVDLSQLRNSALREKIQRALQYQAATRRTIRGVTAPGLRQSLETITRQMNEPIELIFSLARRYEDYQEDRLLMEDRLRLQQQAATRGAKSLSAEEQAQLGSLEKLETLMQEAARAIDGALAGLGASYSQTQLVRSTGEMRGGQAERVLQDLEESSSQLRDLSAALDEVYGGKEPTR